ncbi:hypothetical protein [Streptomyces cyaneus]|nr:hypothetical protein [Streptomyces cyaneus]
MSHKNGSENVTELCGDKFESITVGRAGEKTTGKIPASGVRSARHGVRWA